MEGMGTQRWLFVAFLDVETACFRNRGSLFFFLHIVCIIGLLFVLYHFFGLGVLNLSPSFIIPTCCYHIGMNGKSFS
jgi:hypothetical protein